MKTTRGHAEVSELRTLIGLDGTRPPMRKRWSHGIRGDEKKRSLSWSKFTGKHKGAKEEVETPERVDEEDLNKGPGH